jgi:hypothetical protein
VQAQCHLLPHDVVHWDEGKLKLSGLLLSVREHRRHPGSTTLK